MKGKGGQSFRVTTASVPVGSPATHSDTIQIAMDVSQKEQLLARYRFLVLGHSAGDLCDFSVGRLPDRAARHPSRGGNGHDRSPYQFDEPAGTHSVRKDIRPSWRPWPAPSTKCWTAWKSPSIAFRDSLPTSPTICARPVNNIRGEAEVALARLRSADEYRDVIESCLEEAVRLSDAHW